jgi:hypothetical protein
MDKASEAILGLKPVMFRSTCLAKLRSMGSHFGAIAEAILGRGLSR